ncbi:peptidase U32 family protein [Hydrogenobaculum acidophilum]
MKKPEILSPVGTFESLMSAIKAGADAVYMGFDKLNQRAGKGGFSKEDIKQARLITKDYNVKQYITLNSIVFEEDIPYLEDVLDFLKDIKVDAVIAWDFSVVLGSLARGLETHISTMASVSNSISGKFYKDLGIKRIVPAKELDLDSVKSLKQNTGLEVEVFVHGSMCMAVSGRCFLSHEVFQKSGNRGECYQVCRHEFDVKVISKNSGTEYYLGSDYVMSAKDLLTINFVDKLMWADAWKIEGRNKNPDYVYMSTKAYKEARDRILNNEWKDKGYQDLLDMLERVYHREWDSGFYFKEASFGINSSIAKEEKIYVGDVIKFYPKASVAEVKIVAHPLKIGDTIHIIGKSTGLVRQKVESMEIENQKVEEADKGMTIGLKVAEKVREKDKVYLIKEK